MKEAPCLFLVEKSIKQDLEYLLSVPDVITT